METTSITLLLSEGERKDLVRHSSRCTTTEKNKIKIIDPFLFVTKSLRSNVCCIRVQLQSPWGIDL